MPIPITTTSHIENHKISKYICVISAEIIMGVHIGKDIQAKISDVVGGRAGCHEEELNKATREALKLIELRAMAKLADAIIGLRLDHEPTGASNGMLTVFAYGTAVKLEKIGV